MNKLFLSIALVSTCLISNITWANSSFGNSVIDKHNKNVQTRNSDDSPQSNTNTDPHERGSNNAIGAEAIKRHNKNVNSEKPVR
jgi:hypothetical protein